MLDFNVGELATRLRNLLAVRGRMPLGLDESIVSTVLSADASGPPYRRAGLRFYGSCVATTIATQAGRFARCGLRFQQNVPPLQLPQVFVVDAMQIVPGSFTTATGAAVAALQPWELIFYRGNAGALASSTVCVSSEAYLNTPQATMGDFLSNIETQIAITAGAAPAIATVPFLTGQSRPDSAPPWFSCQIPIYSDVGLCVSNLLASTATDQASLRLNVTGLLYPNALPLV